MKTVCDGEWGVWRKGNAESGDSRAAPPREASIRCEAGKRGRLREAATDKSLRLGSGTKPWFKPALSAGEAEPGE